MKNIRQIVSDQLVGSFCRVPTRVLHLLNWSLSHGEVCGSWPVTNNRYQRFRTFVSDSRVLATYESTVELCWIARLHRHLLLSLQSQPWFRTAESLRDRWLGGMLMRDKRSGIEWRRPLASGGHNRAVVYAPVKDSLGTSALGGFTYLRRFVPRRELASR